MIKITEQIIQQIYVNNGLKYYDRIDIIQYMCEFAKINTPLRIGHFLSQLAHESGEFRYRIELRSDENAEEVYGHNTSIGNTLGNNKPGDGAKYKGRGFIQLTGKHNYQEYSDATRLDFVNNPEWLERDFWAFHSACWYWSSRDLNKLADRDKVRAITRRINGGYNGMESRLRYLNRAKRALR